MNDLCRFFTNCGVAAFKVIYMSNGDLFPTVNMGNVRKALEILKPMEHFADSIVRNMDRFLRVEKKKPKKQKEGKNK